MMPNKTLATIALAFVLLLILMLSAFTVNEGESALVLRLGTIVNKQDPYGPGLHFCVPFLDRVQKFDMRMQESTSKPLVVVTKEQTYLVVEYFARWRINDLSRFLTSTGGGNVGAAEDLLEQKLNDIVRAEYGKRTSDQAISGDRASMMANIRVEANTAANGLGITVLDVRIQQITLPKDVMDSVFKRMATERKQFAEAKRAEGIEKSEEIKAMADQKVTVIKAQALMEGAVVRAKGDAEAAQIYSQAYSANPDFYSFYRSLNAYQDTFAHKTDILVLKPEGQFFKYFHGMQNTGSASKP